MCADTGSGEIQKLQCVSEKKGPRRSVISIDNGSNFRLYTDKLTGQGKTVKKNHNQTC